MFSFKKPAKRKMAPNSGLASPEVDPVIVKKAARRRPKKAAKEKSNVSGFYAASYKMLGNRAMFLAPRLSSLEARLEKGMMMVPYEAYLSAMVVGGMIAGIISLVAAAIFVNIINLQPTELKIFLPFIAGAAGFEAAFGLMYKYPDINVSARNRRLAEEAPYFIGYMATLAASGLTLEGIFKAIAKEDTKEEFVKSARYVVRDLDILGMDIITALTNLISKTPPGAFNELLEGLISTVQSGGNLQEFFTACAKVQMEEKKMIIQKMTASLGIVAEIYTILLVVFPLMAVIMFSIMATMAKNFLGFDITTVMMLIAYLLVPIFGVMIVIMVDGMVPKR